MIDIHDDRVEIALDAWAKASKRHELREQYPATPRHPGLWHVITLPDSMIEPIDYSAPGPADGEDGPSMTARPFTDAAEAQDVRRRLILADIIEALGIKATVCGACGEPWTEGKTCGQKDNGHPFATCYPASEP